MWRLGPSGVTVTTLAVTLVKGAVGRLRERALRDQNQQSVSPDFGCGGQPERLLSSSLWSTSPGGSLYYRESSLGVVVKRGVASQGGSGDAASAAVQAATRCRGLQGLRARQPPGPPRGKWTADIKSDLTGPCKRFQESGRPKN